MRHRTKVVSLIRYVVSISLIRAGFTLLLDKLAAAAEAPALVHTLVIQGSAGMFALGGVALFNVVRNARN